MKVSDVTMFSMAALLPIQGKAFARSGGGIACAESITRLSLFSAVLVQDGKTSKSNSFEVHAPVGKDGDGLYTASTKGCFDVIDAATPAVLQAIDAIPRSKDSTTVFSIADYGTADGGTSLGLMAKIVKAVRDKSNDDKREILINYEDQRENEWKSVFNHILGVKTVTDAYGNVIKTPRTDPTSGIFVSACGVGFHDQAFPSNSIDLGISFTAMHWLSQGPNSLKGTQYMHPAQCPEESSFGEEERIQAQKDWLRILQARAKELRPGGRLVVANFCKSKEAYFLGNTDVGVNMWDSFQTCWDQLAKGGLIDEEERLGVSFPNYYRSTEECISGVNEVEGLLLVECVERVVRCPYREAWTNGNVENRSPREQAEWFVPTTRAWSESTFKSALKSHRNKDAIMEQFWSNYVDLVQNDPASHGMDYVHTYLVIEKE
jgi:hypothetical protein